jgi:hypothetical protein
MINDNDKYSKNDDIFSHDIRHIFAQQTAKRTSQDFRREASPRFNLGKTRRGKE